MESVIDDLTEKAGVKRKSLYMAWDFTVASQESVTGRATTIRDDAFARLGDTDLADRTIQGDSPLDYHRHQRRSTPPASATCTRRGRGHHRGPLLPGPGRTARPAPSSTFDADGALTWNPAYEATAPFRCVIPDSVETTTPGSITPARPRAPTATGCSAPGAR